MLPGIKLFDLTDRVAIITGGSKGLGEAMGAGLASAGANLMLVSRNAEEAQATAAQIAADYDCKAIGFAADVSQQSDMEAMAAKCLEEFGRIDIVVNNAGVFRTVPVMETTEEIWDEQLNLNLRGYFFMSVFAGKRMKAQGGGAMVNVASANGLSPGDKQGVYSITKAGIVNMTKAFARECGGPDPLEPWDIAFYSERLRQSSLGFSEEEVRAYFPEPRVLAGMFEVARRLYGLTFEPREDVEVWDPHVRYFDVRDAEGELRGGLYVDLYARDGKRGGAWMDEVQGRRALRDGLRVPVSRRIGEEGEGFRYLLDGLNPERILISGEAIGIGRAAMAKATQYAKDRVVFDRPIGQNQGIAFPLGEAHMKLHAAELVLREASWRYDNGLPCGEAANTAFTYGYDSVTQMQETKASLCKISAA